METILNDLTTVNFTDKNAVASFIITTIVAAIIRRIEKRKIQKKINQRN